MGSPKYHNGNKDKVMIRAKKKKKKDPLDLVPKFEIIKIQNRLHIALIVRTLWDVYGWREKRIGDFLEGYMALLGEVYDLRQTVDSMVDETSELTGVDIRATVDNMIKYGRKHD